jgi:chorismate mutase
MRKLEEVRQDLDKIDKKFIELFLQRMSLSEEIALIKEDTDKEIKDKSREEAVQEEFRNGTEDIYLGEALQRLAVFLMKESREYQAEILRKGIEEKE